MRWPNAAKPPKEERATSLVRPEQINALFACFHNPESKSY